MAIVACHRTCGICVVLLSCSMVLGGDKHEVPYESALRASKQLVRGIFEDQLPAAKQPQEKVALAESLLTYAADSGDDPPAAYVLMTVARDLAVRANDIDMALRAVAAIEKQFSVDSWKTRLDVARAVQAATTDKQESAALVAITFSITDRAAVAERYDIAKMVATIRIELKGFLKVPKDMEIWVWHAGASSTGGRLYINIAGQRLGMVGDDAVKNAVHRFAKPPGVYPITWELTGGVLSDCYLEFLDSKTKRPLSVVHSLDILREANAPPLRAIVDNSAKRKLNPPSQLR